MANTKRRLAKTKTPPKAVNLGACLRFYAPNEKTHVDAVKRLTAQIRGYWLAVTQLSEVEILQILSPL